MLLAAPVAAQPDASPDAAALWQQWTQSVRLAHERIDEVAYTEEIEEVIDSPFAQHRLRVLSDVIVRPDVDRPVRDVRRAEIGGETVAPVRVPLLQRRLRRAVPDLSLVERAAALPLAALARLRPVGRLVPVEIEGQAAWRLEAVAPRADAPVERATLWFARTARERPVLLRSQVIARPARVQSGQPIVIMTEYTSIDGLPFPRHRRVEATLQQRRRIRTFTVLVTIEASFRDIEVAWQ